MKHVKLAASDMDHTLLTEQGQLPPGFYDCIHQLKELGVRFAIASGRPLYTLKKIFKGHDELVLISDNGGAIYLDGEDVFISLMENERCQEIIQFTEANTEAFAVLFGLDAAYVSKKYQKYEELLRIYITKIKFVDDLNQINVPTNKISILCPNKQSQKYYEELYDPQYGTEFSVTIGDQFWIDLTNQGVSKGSAMRFLGEKLGIDANQMMAFGDTYNDMEMLKAVKYSYVVENASEDMHQYANYVTKSNNEYGVIAVLEELIDCIKRSK